MRRIVVKVGTSTLTYPTGLINIRHLERLCKVLADLKNAGNEILLVTSGAVGVGMGKLGLAERPRELTMKQAAAAVGQCELMNLYAELLGKYDHTVAQILLTRDIVDLPHRAERASITIRTLLGLRVIPIFNENDAIASEELETVTTFNEVGETTGDIHTHASFGDNDTLSAIVAGLAEADLLVLLSDIEGLYDADPHRDPDARLIPVVREITPDLYRLAGGAGSKNGTGGMLTKLKAAEIALSHGCEMAILSGDCPELLYDLLEGKTVGTRFTVSPKQ